MVTGYRGHDDWRDMSEYVVHFVKGDVNQDGYWPMMGILSTGEIWATGPFGIAATLEVQGLADTQKSACFAEIPLDQLDRLTDRRRTKYGIAFAQQKVLASGGGRVWYVDQFSAPYESLRSIIVAASDVDGSARDPAAALWELTRYVDVPRARYRFEWEREWRVPGGLAFDPNDVAFLFIPEEHHDAARQFFEEALANNTGPAYFCPYLDPAWDDARIQEAVAALPPPPQLEE